jgi:hypothetical protein
MFPVATARCRGAILGLRSKPISVAGYDRMRRAQTFGSSSSSPRRSTSLRKPAVGRDTEAGPLKLGDRLVVLAAALVLAPPTLREECPTQPHERSLSAVFNDVTDIVVEKTPPDTS